MRILLFSIKIFCIYSEQSIEVWYWHWETVAVPANPRGALWCRTVNHCLKTPRIWTRKTSFLSNDSFQELEVLFPRCWRRTFCLLLLLFNWWAFIFFMDVEECRWTFTAWWYVGGSLSRTAQQCVEEKHVFCQQVYSYFTVLKYFTQQLLLFKQRYTSNKVSLNL